jgi:predicted NBD/HSP70 family sugar kinase
MYVGIDVGGTKTLVAVLDDKGVIKEEHKFPTNQDYDEFLRELADVIDGFTTKEFKACGIGIPATTLDRTNGIGLRFSNLPWRHVHVQEDVERIVNCPVAIENDAKLACLSESMLLQEHHKVLYVTISTGIGYGLTRDLAIDPNVGDGGGKLILLEYKGKQVSWESFASGHAIVERFGKRAEDIHDKATWLRIAHDLALGFIELIAVLQPTIIVIGGSVGNYLDRFKPYLVEELEKYKNPLLVLPDIVQAQRPDYAVVYGCYDYAVATFPHLKKKKTAKA